MPLVKLEARPVERVWGRQELKPPFQHLTAAGDPIGEVWFEAGADEDPPLLVKYLFTSEKLSIQVHPDDAAAQAKGYPRGKDEAWLVLEAEPEAVIAIGLEEPATPERVRAAALDGSIEELVHWQPVQAGQILYSPAGTIHAIGSGLSLIEIQQNLDLTYRLYDYGRGRELHLEDGLAVADPSPYTPPFQPYEISPGREIVATGAFVLERWTGARSGAFPASEGRPLTIVPVRGSGSADAQQVAAGEVWMADSFVELALKDDAEILVAYPGSEIMEASVA